METLRCLIADIPHKVLADIVQRVTHQDEKIEVVGQVSNAGNISELLQKQKIDVLIIGIRDAASHQFCHSILKRFPDLLVVGLVDDGRITIFYMAGLGSEQLVNLIRDIGVGQIGNNL